MYQLRSKSEKIVTMREFNKNLIINWFNNLCNIPWNWEVVRPDGSICDGRNYDEI